MTLETAEDYAFKRGYEKALQDVENCLGEMCDNEGLIHIQRIRLKISQLKNNLTTAPIADGKAIHSKLLDCNRRLRAKP